MNVAKGAIAGTAVAPSAASSAVDERQDIAAYVRKGEAGTRTLHLLVDGIHCAGCVQRIESTLRRRPGVVNARVNLTTRRLAISWKDGEADPVELVTAVEGLGFRLVPYDPARLSSEFGRTEKELLRAMAIAGFAAANVMLLSVAVWAGNVQGMGAATRALMHWVSALIALPAVVYAGRPFYRSALRALRSGGLNMDVPISLAVVLAAGMSLFETVKGGDQVYFDSAVALLFFLLVGRYLDRRARGKARSAAEHLMSLGASAVTVIDAEGRQRVVPPEAVARGMTVLVAAGERVPVDGTVVEGISDIDTSLITGESVPAAARPGERVFAGTINLTAPLRLAVTGIGDDTLLAEIARLTEAAEQRRTRYVTLADRIIRFYAPAVHGLALVTFVGWLVLGGVGWQTALLNAIAVLIITCPCALGLAVPVVQVVASGRLMRRGILLKSATALERLVGIDTVVFDKTGTLTEGRPELVEDGSWTRADLDAAAALAAASRHPLARALAQAAPHVAAAPGVEEVPGLGLRRTMQEGEIRLGSRAWCGVGEESADPGPELWLTRPGCAPVRFAFRDRLRADAAEVVAALRREGIVVELLSGDRAATVREIAAAVGIAEWRAECRPADKTAYLEGLAARGRRVCMVGDGLNDAPALAAAHVSMSPASAADIAQTAADIVFQGGRLAPVCEARHVAERTQRLVRQNFALALLYNAVTVPLAMAGLVTPLIAAVAMSSSSLVVIANALRLGLGGKR